MKKKDLHSTAIHVIDTLVHLLMWGMVIALIVFWKKIPDEVPAHYGMDGMVDRYSDKNAIFLIVFLAVFVYVMHLLLMNVVPVLSGKEDIVGKKAAKYATEEDIRTMLIIVLKLIGWLNVLCLLIFDYIILCIAACVNLGALFGLLSLGSITVECVYYIVKIYATQRAIRKRKS